MIMPDTIPATIEPEADDVETLRLVDEGLARFSDRKLVSSEELTDLLLDIRRSLTREGP